MVTKRIISDSCLDLFLMGLVLFKCNRVFNGFEFIFSNSIRVRDGFRYCYSRSVPIIF